MRWAPVSVDGTRVRAPNAASDAALMAGIGAGTALPWATRGLRQRLAAASRVPAPGRGLPWMTEPRSVPRRGVQTTRIGNDPPVDGVDPQRSFAAMYALAIIRYRRPFEEIAPHVDEHRAYLRELKAAGVLLASGPFDPRTGGGLLLRLPDTEGPAALDRIRDGDPFTKRALAQYELLPWNPVIGKDDLDRL